MRGRSLLSRKLIPRSMNVGHNKSTRRQQSFQQIACQFAVHSTFRHKKTGAPLRPEGLQWNLPGISHVTYVTLGNTDLDAAQLEDPQVKRLIVEAHNRWTFARGEPFACVDDIETTYMTDHQHITVKWKDSLKNRVFKEEPFGEIAEMIREDKAAKDVAASASAEVWINGKFVGNLHGSDTVPAIIGALSKETSHRLAFKRSDDGFIRIERYFGSYLRRKDEIFDHVLDNLIAMEDITLLDSETLIGTATLQDWIMGGRLTSRIWVRDMGDRIRFLRPLRDDDIETSDRKFDLVRGTDDEKIARVQTELARLRWIATIHHTWKAPELPGEKDPLEEVRNQLSKNHSRRKFFGL